MLTIAYTSSANGAVSDDDLAGLLIRARERNARLKITGALLFRNGHFIKVIEGPERAVRTVFASIVANPLHRNIHLVADEEIAERRFPAWKMGYHALVDLSGGEIIPGPENFFGAYPPRASQPGERRPSQSQALFDWLYGCWITPVAIAARPAKRVFGDETPGTVAQRSPAVEVPHAAESANVALAAINSASGASIVVSAIFDKIMTDVASGTLLPGDIIRDSSIAKQLGTSRTPVREALQKLRAIGVVESLASRFTRIAQVSPEKAAQSITVLTALYGAVLEETIGNVNNAVIEGLQRDRDEFLNSVAVGNSMSIATSGAAFYLRLVDESENPALKEGIYSVIQVVKLAAGHLHRPAGTDVIAESHEIVLAAAIAGDLAEAKRGLGMLTKFRR